MEKGACFDLSDEVSLRDVRVKQILRRMQHLKFNKEMRP